MKTDFAVRFTAWLFVVAAVLAWGGWMLIPVDLGPYVQTEDFSIIDENRYLFVWSYRCYFFGSVLTAMAVTAMAAIVSRSPSRVMIWPGAVAVAGGAFVYAVGSAFYYHHGYWGSLDVIGKPAEVAVAYVESIRMDTKFVTCFIRFGRLFAGLGLLVLSLGLIRWNELPRWIGWFGSATGFAAIVVVMFSSDAFWVYAPVFHAHALWMVAVGLTVLRKGIDVQSADAAEKAGAVQAPTEPR